MFFSSKVISALESDHDKLRDDADTLKNIELPYEIRRTAFIRMAPILNSHSQREEKVIYNFMLTLTELRPWAKEGIEEHKIIDELVTQLKQPLSAEKWGAKAKVFAELLTSHLAEEESNIFPKLKKLLDGKLDDELCEQYKNDGDFNDKFPPQDTVSMSYPPQSIVKENVGISFDL